MIHVFGNADIAMDSLPLRLLSRLSGQFPDIDFVTLDPNEEWEIPDQFIIIDTVVGLNDVHLFRSLDEFGSSPTVSMHDFDALFNLRYLAKLGKLKEIRIIGVPSTIEEEKALTEISSLIKTLLPLSDEDR